MSRKQRAKARRKKVSQKQREKVFEAIRNLLALEGFEVRRVKDNVSPRSRYQVCTVHDGRIWCHMTLSNKHSLETVMMYLSSFKVSRANIRAGRTDGYSIELE